jgi:predicted nucleotidyltransferase component of viral defense system
MNYDSVRAKVRSKSRDTGVKADVLYRRFLLERFIARIAASEHSDSVIIKGGMLLSAIAGIDMRSTRDLDATIRGKSLTLADFENIMKDIIAVKIDDGVVFEFIRADEIVIDNSYPCSRVHLRVMFGTMDERVEIDVTTGDVITPCEIEFGFPTLLGDEKIPILAYTLETVLAEKITALLDLGVYNTRAKDFYDLRLITTLQSARVDKATLVTALRNTLRSRGKSELLTRCREIVLEIVNSPDIHTQWDKYRNEYSYAAEIDFKQIVSAINTVFSWAEIPLNIQPQTPPSWIDATIAKGKRKAAEYKRENPASDKSNNGQEL